MEVTEALRAAVRDYREFLDRGYPAERCRVLVADRFRLTRDERMVLYRGVGSSAESEKRAGRRVSLDDRPGGPLHIDGLNVIYTIASYLMGRPVFASTDGWVRDVGSAHGSPVPSSVLERTLELLRRSLFEPLRDSRELAVCVLDRAADITPEVADALVAMPESGGELVVRIEADADRWLTSRDDGVVATSDTRIIAATSRPVVDLPFRVLTGAFGAQFVELGAIR